MSEFDLAKYPGLYPRPSGVWYVRKRVPRDLMHLDARWQIRLSLETSDRKTAVKRYPLKLAEIEAGFAKARAELAAQGMISAALTRGKLELLGQTEIEKLVSEWWDRREGLRRPQLDGLDDPAAVVAAIDEDASALGEPHPEDGDPAARLVDRLLVSAGIAAYSSLQPLHVSSTCLDARIRGGERGCAVWVQSVREWRRRGSLLVQLVLEAGEVRLEFADGLECSGPVASYVLRDYAGIAPPLPDLSHCTMGWNLCREGTPHEQHRRLSRMRGGPKAGSNSLTWSDRWRAARAVVEIPEPGSCFISIARPADPSLAAYLTPLISQGAKLFISVHVDFASVEGVEWPTVEGFLERGEPLFAEEQPRFTVYRPDHPDLLGDDPVPEGILRHGSLWKRPRKG